MDNREGARTACADGRFCEGIPTAMWVLAKDELTTFFAKRPPLAYSAPLWRPL